MLKTNLISLLGVMVIFILISSCEDKGCGETKISAAGEDESHNSGQDCMECHHDGGKGEGCFIVAGTTYKQGLQQTFPNATVHFYTEPDGGGDEVATFVGDSKGNFYSTNNVNFGNGLFVGVKSSQGDYYYMEAPVTNGSCNSCHSSDASRIEVK